MVSVVQTSTAACSIPKGQGPDTPIRSHLRQLVLCACLLSLLVLSPSIFHQLTLLTSETTPRIPFFSESRIGLPAGLTARRASTASETGADVNEIIPVPESLKTAGETGGHIGATSIWNEASDWLNSIFTRLSRPKDFQPGRKQGPREFSTEKDAGFWKENRIWRTRASGEDFTWGSERNFGRGNPNFGTKSDTNSADVRRMLIDVEYGEVMSEGEWEEWGGDDTMETGEDSLSLDLSEGEWEGDDLGTILEIAHAAAEERSIQ